jgi:multiple sugar transport system permease protein
MSAVSAAERPSARRRTGWISRALLYAAAILVSLWVLVPIYLIALSAFSTQQDVYEYPKKLLPTDLSTDTISFFLNSEGVYGSLWRSVIVAAGMLVLTMAIGTPAGYALARFSFRGADTFRLALVSTRAFPVLIIAIPLSVTYLRLGIDDSVLGVALAHTAFALPFAVLVTASVFAGISVELEEAAMTLGCTRATAFQRVVLPLALPGLAAAAIFVFIVSWNEVFAASVLTLRERTLPAQVLSTLEGSPLPYKFAGGFFLLAPAFIVIFVIRKYVFNMWGRTVR